MPWWAFGIANFVIVFVLALGFWYLLVDPVVSPLKTYPFPFEEVLFWAILTVVFVGFNLEFHGFDRIRQPLRGLILIVLVVVVAIAITALMAVWGHYDPTFAASRTTSDGTQVGQLTPALYVLFGFFTYLTVVINWEHWPFKSKGLKQPAAGWAEIFAVTGPTIILFILFILPNAATWAKPGHVPFLDLTTSIGVVYCIIVVAIVTGIQTDNWPWRLAGAGGRQAITSLIGNIIGGIILYFIFIAITEAFLGSAAVAKLGDNVTKFPAELGVCWVFWIIMWQNGFGNWPNKANKAANYLTRIGITLVLGLITFAVYYFVFAKYVTHEPAVAGAAYGDALGWMDWMVLWILFYVVSLGSYGLPGIRAEANTGTPVKQEEDVPA